MSPFLMNVCASAIVIIFNKSLLLYGGDLAIGAYGILNRLLMLFVMVIMGLTMGMQPIVGYNHGAHKFGQVKQTLKYCMIAGGASLRWDLFSANFSLIWLLICLQTIKNLQHWHALGCKSES